MNRLEVLAPAGGPESLEAAVRAGADAVYLGASLFSARAGAQNFSREELAQAVRYCHVRGVRVHLAVNTLLRDEELLEALQLVAYACTLPVDAVLVQDPGLLFLLRRACSQMPLHASTQMSIHTPCGVRACRDAGFSRVVLAREMSLFEIEQVHREIPDMELESFVHGALCMSVSGQCWFSAVLGGRSGNRGQCAQPCRLPFSAPGGTGHDLSLKDLSAVSRLDELQRAGVCSFKIEGRMKRPEYVAAAAHACRLAVDGRPLPQGLLEDLRNVFSRSGFTTGYLDAKRGREMFGVRTKADAAAATAAQHRLRALYRREMARVPVRFCLTVSSGRPVQLDVFDDGGRQVCVQSAVLPQPAKTAPVTKAFCAEHLQKTGGTPFFAREIECRLQPDLSVAASVLNQLRRSALEQLAQLRAVRAPVPFSQPAFSPAPHQAGTLRLRARFPDSDVPDAASRCESVLVPYDLPVSSLQVLRARGMRVWLELPRGMFGAEDTVRCTLREAAESGFGDVWVGTLNSAALAKELGLTLHGGFSLNVTNSAAVDWYTEFGLSDTELSFELTLRQAALLGGNLPRGLLVYGRLPLMLTRNCPLANCGRCNCRSGTAQGLTDRRGTVFPVQCFGSCSEVLNSVPLSLLGRLHTLQGKMDFAVLRFTTETPAQREQILELAFADRPFPGNVTRGLYDRGVL